MAKNKNVSKVIIAGVWRASFMHIFSPTEDLNGKLGYSLDVLIPKDKKKMGNIGEVKSAYTSMCNEVFGAPEATNRPWAYTAKMKADKAIIKDGDARYNNADIEKRETYASYRGHYYMSLRLDPGDGKPVVLDRAGIPIADESELQSGDYVRVQFRMFAYDHVKWGQQVSLRLIGVQKIKTGERFTNALIDVESAVNGFQAADWDQDEWTDDDGTDDWEEAAVKLTQMIAQGGHDLGPSGALDRP